ncbi:hypothetical protein AGRA3207_002424 [Actinomadura graeca]|uniref:Uncharacterized protein n=1 Tax=Actinomadura graeca TaxID=2750812 RepID=A0ABX8QRX6_9ACTN|nr:hypothetical protein [Actinomadura graeca]QXJ21561.1 hypothetical protein AGRA3207_002424 [Actinomadura graeca]
MALRFYGKGNKTDQCPAVFWHPAPERIYFQGDKVTEPKLLDESTSHSPMLPGEAVVALPPHMAAIIMEAAREFLAAHPEVVQRPVEGVQAVGSEAGAA